MYKYITQNQAEFINTIEIIESKKTSCACGQTYAIIHENQTEQIVCDECAYIEQELHFKI